MSESGSVHPDEDVGIVGHLRWSGSRNSDEHKNTFYSALSIKVAKDVRNC